MSQISKSPDPKQPSIQIQPKQSNKINFKNMILLKKNESNINSRPSRIEPGSITSR
jgi:hypothetical protein